MTSAEAFNVLLLTTVLGEVHHSRSWKSLNNVEVDCKTQALTGLSE